VRWFDRLYVPFFHRTNPPGGQDLPHALPSQAITLGDVIHAPAAYEVQEHKSRLKIWPGLFPEGRNLRWKTDQILRHRLPQNLIFQVNMDAFHTFNSSTQ
jgi:hypothetical protein